LGFGGSGRNGIPMPRLRIQDDLDGL
jgi:hypothetical protein